MILTVWRPENFSLGPGDLWVMGVHPGKPHHYKKVLDECDMERDFFLIKGTDSEKEG